MDTITSIILGLVAAGIVVWVVRDEQGGFRKTVKSEVRVDPIQWLRRRH